MYAFILDQILGSCEVWDLVDIPMATVATSTIISSYATLQTRIASIVIIKTHIINETPTITSLAINIALQMKIDKFIMVIITIVIKKVLPIFKKWKKVLCTVQFE